MSQGVQNNLRKKAGNYNLSNPEYAMGKVDFSDQVAPKRFVPYQRAARRKKSVTEAGAGVKANAAIPFDNVNLSTELLKLVELRDLGVLTEEEFSAAKAKLLGLEVAAPRIYAEADKSNVSNDNRPASMYAEPMNTEVSLYFLHYYALQLTFA